MQYSYYMGNTVDNKYIVEIVIVEKQLKLDYTYRYRRLQIVRVRDGLIASVK